MPCIAAPEVPDDVFNAIRKHYNEREIAELTVLVGTYMMHNRVFTALRVDVEPKKGLHRNLVAGIPACYRNVEAWVICRRGRSVHAADPAGARSHDTRRNAVAAFADFMSYRRAGLRRLVRPGAQGLQRRPLSGRGAAGRASEEDMRANLKDCTALVIERCASPRDDLPLAPKPEGAAVRHWASATSTPPPARKRHKAAHAAPTRQHLLRRARTSADADAGAQAGRTRLAWSPSKRIKARQGASKPFHTPHRRAATSLRLGRHQSTERCDHRHHWPRRDRRARLRSGPGPSAMSVLYHQSHAGTREPRSAGARHVPLATLHRRKRLDPAQAADAALDAQHDRPRRARRRRKRGGLPANAANAPIVNEALIEALRAGQLGGAALDMHYQEPVAGRRRAAHVRQRDPDAAHGGLAAPQRPERFRRAHHRARQGARQ